MNKKRLLKGRCLIVAWALVIQFTSFPGLLSTCPCAEIVDRIVAVVNDDIIQLSTLNEALSPYERQIRAKGYSPEKERDILYSKRMQMLNDLIDDKLADQEIESAQITVSEKEVDNAIEQIKAMNHYTDEDLRHELTVTGLNMARYRKEIKKQILRNKLVNYRVKSNIVITKTDIKAYYEAHMNDYSAKKQYMLKNIMMHVPPASDDETRASVYARMQKVLVELKNGASFEDTARKSSQAINAGDGGELGLFSLDELSEKIRAAVQQMKAGEFSGIVETDLGYQIFYVEKIVEVPGKSLADASDEILKKLYDQAVNDKFHTWIEELRKNANIKIVR